MTVDVERPPRPTQVTVACWLQLAAVVLLVGMVGLAVAQAVYYNGEISRVAALVGDADPDEVSGERVANVMSTLFVGLPALVLALWLGLTARPLLRGSNVARILVFVAGGGQLLLVIVQTCGGFLLAPLLFSSVDDGDVMVDDGVSWEESEFIGTLYSSTEMFSGILFAGAVLVALTVLVGTIAVVLLLALPPANRYFVPKAPQTWQTWPPHPAIGPMPYYICPDPSAHLPAEPPSVPPAPAQPVTPAEPPATVTAEPAAAGATEPPAPAPAQDQPKE
jgi:hypothetical protein